MLKPDHLRAVLVLQPSTLGAFALLFSFIGLFVYGYSKNKRAKLLPDIPVIGVGHGKTLLDARQRFLYDARNMMREGYENSENGFFYIPSPTGERLMIPTRYIEELKNSPDDQVNFSDSFIEMFEGNFTTIGVRWNLHPGVVKGALNSRLWEVMPAVEDEILSAMSTMLPSAHVWTPICVAPTFQGIIAQASSRMLGGAALSTNGVWVNTAMNFTMDCFMAAQKLKKYPKCLRPFIQYCIVEMSRVRAHQNAALSIIKPLVDAIEEETKTPDLLHMLWDAAKGPDKTPEFMAYTTLAVSFAAINTSASVPAHLIFDLCSMPEHVETLREEMASALAEEGGQLTRTTLLKMPKLDSFMKESQRFHPLVFRSLIPPSTPLAHPPPLSLVLHPEDKTIADSSYCATVTFGRVIHKPLTLSTGLTIPAHTTIGVPSHAITHDPVHYPDPHSFKPFRFVTDRSVPQDTPPSLFVSSNQHNMSWGYGKHACSGRFFAASEIKMIMVHLLLGYDFKFKEGQERPRDVSFELQNAPDPRADVLMRRRL